MNKPMTPLLSVRQKIQAVIPEIMELKFGCEVDAVKGTRTFFVGRNEVEDENYFIDIDQVGSEDHQFLCEGNSSSKILGRPITLVDVLRAIDKQGLEISVECDGSFFERSYGGWKRMSVFRWNLSLPFDQQSPEVFEFLDEILK